MQRMTTSRYSAKHTCDALEDYQYEQGYRPTKKAQPLVYGTLIHAGLEAWWKYWRDGSGACLALDHALDALDAGRPESIDDFTYAAITALMVGYDVRWGPTMDKVEVLAVECEYSGPLTHPDGRTAPGWLSCGKIDAIFRYIPTGKTYLVEHKSSNADLSPGSWYWTKLRMDPQLSAYFDGAKVLGYDVAGCYYDVLAKPTIKPRKATGEIKYTKGRECSTKAKPCEGDQCKRCGGSRWKEPPRPCAGQRETDETVEEFKTRVVKAIGADPDKYYKRQMVVRLDSELDQARLDFWHTAQQIGAFSGIHKPRNLNACHRFGSTCAFFGVCSGTDTLDSDRFERVGAHPELATETDETFANRFNKETKREMA